MTPSRHAGGPSSGVPPLPILPPVPVLPPLAVAPPEAPPSVPPLLVVPPALAPPEPATCPPVPGAPSLSLAPPPDPTVVPPVPTASVKSLGCPVPPHALAQVAQLAPRSTAILEARVMVRIADTEAEGALQAPGECLRILVERQAHIVTPLREAGRGQIQPCQIELLRPDCVFGTPAGDRP